MLLDYFGILVIAVLGGARLKQTLMGEWWAVPLFTHAALSAFLLVIHRHASRRSPLLQRLVAWASALLPFAFQINVSVPLLFRLLSLSGVAFAIWSLAVLGKSFDVSPADRGLVSKGPYRWVRHPLYSSELFSVVVMVILDLSLWNTVVTCALIASLIMRIFWEERIINGYSEYLLKVRDRLLPGVW